jgi:hypothetical protein
MLSRRPRGRSVSRPAPRSLLRKLGFALLASLLALLLLEGGLWALALVLGTDWRSPPLPEHTDYPVTCPLAEGMLKLCPEDRHGYERVRPEMFLVEPEGARVIMIGESFVFGLGLAPSEAIPAQLEDRLEGQAEVLNWGRCGSYAGKLVPAVQAAVALEPDLLVLAIGNNEHTMTSYYTGWPARHPVAFYRLSEGLSCLQLFGLLGRALGGGLPTPSEAFERRVELDDPVARAAYSARRRPPDLSLFEDALADPQVTHLLEQEQRLKERIFAARLADLVGLARAAGVPVVLATLPHRLRTPPVLSGIHGGDPARVRALVREIDQDGVPVPEAVLREALAEDPRVSVFLNAWAEQRLSVGDTAGAVEAYRSQAEWELVPDGTPSLNAVVRDVAAARGCALVDLEPLSERSLDPSLPMFLDRVHVDPAGAALVAEALEPVVRAQLGLAPAAQDGETQP